MEIEKHLQIYEKRIEYIEKRKLDYLNKARGKEKELLHAIFYTLSLRRVSPLQVDKYLRILKVVYKHTTLTNLNEKKLMEIVNDVLNLNWSNDTKNTLLSTLKSMVRILSEYTKKDYGLDKLIIKTKLKAITSMDIPTPMEIQSLITFARSLKMKLIISILAVTGLRIGELLSLQYGNIEINDNEIILEVQGKTGQRKVIVNNSTQAYQLFLIYLRDKKNEPSNYVFGNEKPPRYDKLGKQFRLLVRRLKDMSLIRPKLKLTFHTLRHYAVTQAVNKGVPEMYLKKIFGWSKTTKMVARYTKLNDKLAMEFMRKIQL